MNEVQSELERISQNVAATYSVLEDSGADIPSVQNSDNLPAAAGSVRDKVIRFNVLDFGAVGDGSTDSTEAFQMALASERVVRVPGGTYILSGPLLIRGNCCLELSQDTVLKFLQTTGNCISMEMSACIRGNHAVIFVPYDFSGNVVYVSTTLDADVTSIPPWNRWDPQFKAGRYITDLNISKVTSAGFHYALQPTDCKGTAVYISADSDISVSTQSTFIWGLDFSGLGIAGAFSYGVRAKNIGTAWNHEMRVQAFVCNCEIGVSLENCNNAYISATIQPRYAENNGTKTGVYAKHGVQLIDSANADLTGSRVWDWNSTGTLWQNGNQWQHIGMYGDCHGTILNCFHYYDEASIDVRDQIYTDTPSNLEKLTILQEPFTRWFKPVDGIPYFSPDGTTTKRLLLTDDKISPAQCGFIHEAEGEYVTTPDFTNLVTGYTDGKYLSSGNLANQTGVATTDFIPFDGTSPRTIRIGGSGIHFLDGNQFEWGYTRISWYDANKNHITTVPAGTIKSNQGSIYHPTIVQDDTVAATLVTAATNNGISAGAAYFRICVEGSGANIIVTIDEEQTYTTTWEGTPGMMDESIYAQKTLIKSPGGKLFELKVTDSGVLSATAYSN